MTTSLANLSVRELEQLASKVALELARRDQQKIAAARDQILAIAERLGMDVRDLLGRHSKDTQQRAKVAVKYRNPANAAQEWTGRGRKPRWVGAWLAEGKPLDGLLA